MILRGIPITEKPVQVHLVLEPAELEREQRLGDQLGRAAARAAREAGGGNRRGQNGGPVSMNGAHARLHRIGPAGGVSMPKAGFLTHAGRRGYIDLHG
jgi:hypothetical protein